MGQMGFKFVVIRNSVVKGL